MSYIKYKELTKYFNFDEEIEINSLPNYVTDYLSGNEQIYAAYKTKRDKAIFTDRSMILFDVTSLFFVTKKVHVIPYSSISTGSVFFENKKVSMLFSMDSGYQTRLDFVKIEAKSKTRLRLLFSIITEKIKNR